MVGYVWLIAGKRNEEDRGSKSGRERHSSFARGGREGGSRTKKRKRRIQALLRCAALCVAIIAASLQEKTRWGEGGKGEKSLFLSRTVLGKKENETSGEQTII